MSKEKESRINQEIPFKVKLDIDELSVMVQREKGQRVNQKDLIVELLIIGTIELKKRLK